MLSYKHNVYTPPFYINLLINLISIDLASHLSILRSNAGRILQIINSRNFLIHSFHLIKDSLSLNFTALTPLPEWIPYNIVDFVIKNRHFEILKLNHCFAKLTDRLWRLTDYLFFSTRVKCRRSAFYIIHAVFNKLILSVGLDSSIRSYWARRSEQPFSVLFNLSFPLILELCQCPSPTSEIE